MPYTDDAPYFPQQLTEPVPGDSPHGAHAGAGLDQTIPFDPDDLTVPMAHGLRDGDRIKDGASKHEHDHVVKSMEQYSEDGDYTDAFVAAGGAKGAARAARDLAHKGKPKLFDKDTKRILAQYGNTVAKASRRQAAGKIPGRGKGEKDALKPVLKADDMWSSAMLFKYKPDGAEKSKNPEDAYGNQFDPKFLSHMSSNILDWRSKHDMRPTYNPESNHGGARFSERFVDPDDAWFHTLGLHTNQEGSVRDNKETLDKIREFDPALAVLSRTGESADASQELLTGKSGKKHALQLTRMNWTTNYGGSVRDDSRAPADILTRAAANRDEKHKVRSAEAADSILSAAAKQKDLWDERGEVSKENYSQYPARLSRALAGITGSYALDIGTSGNVREGEHYADKVDPGRIASNPVDTQKVMELIRQDKVASKMLEGVLDAKLSEASSHALTHNRKVDLEALGKVYSNYSKAKRHKEYTAAESKDAEAAKEIILENSIASTISGIPGPGKVPKLAMGLQWSQLLVGASRSGVIDRLDTNHAERQEKKGETETRVDEKSLKRPIMQGLIRSGAVKEPEKKYKWYDKEHHIVHAAKNKEEKKNINAWYRKNIKENNSNIPGNYYKNANKGFRDDSLKRNGSGE